MTLVWPAREYLHGYIDALERGWSPDNLRGELAAREELARIAADPDGFLASLVDREAKGGPITLPDGSKLFVGDAGAGAPPGEGDPSEGAARE